MALLLTCTVTEAKKRPKKERNQKNRHRKGQETTKEEDGKTPEVCDNFLKGNCKDPCPFGRIHPAGGKGKGSGKGKRKE